LVLLRQVTFSVSDALPDPPVLYGAGRSGAFNVRSGEDWEGGLQEAASSGVPWVPLASSVHSSNAGTSLTVVGVADFGRA
jgi:hypothetical protein